MLLFLTHVYLYCYRNTIPYLLSDSDQASFTSSLLPVGVLFLSVVITDDRGASKIYSPESLTIEVALDYERSHRTKYVP